MPVVTTLEPYLSYRCNLQGCCCKEWFIAFKPQDLPPILAAFTPEERERLIHGWRFFVDPDDGTLTRFQFGHVGEQAACQFLAGDGRCGLQVEKGAAVLPHLCRAFPAYAHDGPDGIQVHFDPICPEALNCITDAEGPFRLVEVETDETSDLGVRASRPLRVPDVVIGQRTLSAAELLTVRDRIFAALGDPSRPALDRLAQVHYALARVAAGEEPAAFAVRDDDPVAPFDAWFDQCVGIHHDAALARLFGQFRRFVFAIDLAAADWGALEHALRHDPGWRATVDPRDPELQPMLRRYLVYRFFSAFQRSPEAGELSFTYGTVAHSLATVFRYATGFSRWLGRPADRTLVKVGMGASEWVYRTVRLPTSTMPWFLPE